MDPRLAQSFDAGDCAQPPGRRGLIERLEELQAVGTHLRGIGITEGFPLRQAGFLKALALALEPLRRAVLTQPVGGDHGAIVARSAEGFPPHIPGDAASGQPRRRA